MNAMAPPRVRAYVVHGVRLASAVELPELEGVSCAVTAPEPRATRVCIRLPEPGSVEWPADPAAAAWREGKGQGWLAGTRHGELVRLSIAGLATFVLDPGLGAIDVVALPTTPPDTLRHLLLDHALPRLLAGMGLWLLHASAVETPRGGVAFLGPSGTGKSTLAALMTAAGDRLLSDDGLSVELRGPTAWAVPSYPGVRLSPTLADRLFDSAATRQSVAHYSPKVRVGGPALRWDSAGCELLRLYVPFRAPPGTRPAVEPLPPHDGFLALLGQCFRLVPGEGRPAEELSFLTGLAQGRRVRRLVCPHEPESWPGVRQAVMDDLIGK